MGDPASDPEPVTKRVCYRQRFPELEETAQVYAFPFPVSSNGREQRQGEFFQAMSEYAPAKP